MRALLGSVTAVTGATLLVYALNPIAPTLSLGVVYVLAVLATAVLYGAAFAVASGIASMLAFNFLFLPPVHTLTLTDARNWSALGVYLVTAFVAGELASRARRRAALAEQREQEAAVLADAAAALLREAPLEEIRTRTDAVVRGADARARDRLEAGVAALLELGRERDAAEAVRRSDALKTIILQTVSHDLRTPIATISAAVGGLEDTELALSAEDRLELLETIRLEAARLARLVENVLDLSRLHAGAAAPHSALWDVEELVEQAIAEISDPPRVHADVHDGLPPVLVDAVQIQRALVNLIENALKFSQGEVAVVASARGAEVLVDVLDRGPGLDDAPSTARGLGLGLEIARGFAAANSAQLELAGRDGGGTRARLAFAAS